MICPASPPWEGQTTRVRQAGDGIADGLTFGGSPLRAAGAEACRKTARRSRVTPAARISLLARDLM